MGNIRDRRGFSPGQAVAFRLEEGREECGTGIAG